MEMEKMIIKCPRCGEQINITEEVMKVISSITGIDVIELKNGGMKKVVAVFHSARVILERIEKQHLTVSELERVTEKILPKIVEELKNENNERMKELFEIFKKEVEELKKSNEIIQQVLTKDIKLNQQEIRDYINKLLGNPLVQGKNEEVSLLKRLKAASTGDLFSNEDSRKGEEDILAIVRKNGIEIARISIESKKVSRFDTRRYLKQAKRNKERKNAIIAVIATTTMPADSMSQVVYREGDVYVVHTSVADIFYRILRDFIVREWERIRQEEDFEKKWGEALERIKEILVDCKVVQKLEKAREILEVVLQKLNNLQDYTNRTIVDVRKNLMKELEEILIELEKDYQEMHNNLQNLGDDTSHSSNF